MFVLLLTSEDLNEQLVSSFLHAEAKTLRVLEQLTEDSVGVTQSSAVNAVLLKV